MQPDRVIQQQSNFQPTNLYAELMAHATGLPNDELFAQMISSQVSGVGALPPGLGLDEKDFVALLERHFPGVELVLRNQATPADQRALERDDVLALLLEHRAFLNRSEQWMAEIVTAACTLSHLSQPPDDREFSPACSKK